MAGYDEMGASVMGAEVTGFAWAVLGFVRLQSSLVLPLLFAQVEHSRRSHRS
jgi:hypothetical protein